MSIYFAY